MVRIMTSSDFWHVLSNPFTLGLLLGLVFTGIALYQLFTLKLEMKRYKRHLSDKLEIEAESMKRLRSETEVLRKENENLRVKVAALNEMPDRRALRDLEIFARAEKHMLISVPGFAPAWESAKNDAAGELADEEMGKSLPQRVFTKLFGAPRRDEKALPESETV